MNKEITPSVGVLTSCYNGKKFFKEYLESIVNQTYKPTYLSFVDDCSTDGTWEYILELLGIKENPTKFSIQTNGITLIFQRLPENKGMFHARNIALKEIIDKVDFVQIIDEDDILLPQKIELGVKAAIANPYCSVVYSDYFMTYEDGRQDKYEIKPIFSFGSLLNECIISNNSLVPVLAMKKIGIWWDEDFKSAGDYLYWLKLCAIGCGISIPKALYKYRVHNNQITQTLQQDKLAKEWHLVHKKFNEWSKEAKNV